MVCRLASPCGRGFSCALYQPARHYRCHVTLYDNLRTTRAQHVPSPSVLWRCWFSNKKAFWSVKTCCSKLQRFFLAEWGPSLTRINLKNKQVKQKPKNEWVTVRTARLLCAIEATEVYVNIDCQLKLKISNAQKRSAYVQTSIFCCYTITFNEPWPPTANHILWVECSRDQNVKVVMSYAVRRAYPSVVQPYSVLVLKCSSGTYDRAVFRSGTTARWQVGWRTSHMGCWRNRRHWRWRHEAGFQPTRTAASLQHDKSFSSIRDDCNWQ